MTTTASPARDAGSPSVTSAHDLVRRLIAHLDNGHSTDAAPATMRVPAATYTDPVRWQREREQIFRRTALVAALSAELREPGQYKTLELAGLSVIVVRGQDGVARAHVNRCSHRGTALVSGRGATRRFTCPFHGWSFDDRGGLSNVTSEANFCDLDRAASGLTSLPVREEHGLIWTVGTPDIVIEDQDLLGGLEQDMADLDVKNWHFQYSEELASRTHWRMLLEGVSETYHLPYLHPKTAARIFYSDVITYDAFGNNFRLSWPRRTIDELRGVPEADWTDPGQHINLLYYLFPNTVILHNAGMWQMWPGDTVGESSASFNFFTMTADPVMTDAQRQRFQFAIDVTREEDNPAAEASFRNLVASPDAELVLGANEVCLHQIHRVLDAVVG